MSDRRKQPYQKPFKADPDCGFIWAGDSMHALDVRGWGYLTGGGAMRLDEDYAMQIQDAFQQHVVDALNAYKDFVPPKKENR